jgi:hypothetical protein
VASGAAWQMSFSFQFIALFADIQDLSKQGDKYLY